MHLLGVILNGVHLLARLSPLAACLEHCPQLASGRHVHSWLLADMSTAGCLHTCLQLTACRHDYMLLWPEHCQDSSSLIGQCEHRSVSHLDFGFVLLIGENAHLLHGVQMETLSVSLSDHSIEIYETYNLCYNLTWDEVNHLFHHRYTVSHSVPEYHNNSTNIMGMPLLVNDFRVILW